MQAAEAEKADIVADDVNFIDDGQSTPWSTLIAESGKSVDKIITIDAVYFVETDQYDKPGLHLGLSKPLIRREFLVHNEIQYDEDLYKREDYWFYLECLFGGAKFILVPQPFYFYRSRSGSLIHLASATSLESFYGKTKQFLEQQDVSRLNPALAEAFLKTLNCTKMNLAYQQVVGPIKERRYFLRNPYFIIQILLKAPRILQRRFDYYIRGDRTALTRSHLKG